MGANSFTKKKKKSSPHFLAFSSLLELILNAKASFFLNLNVHVALNIVGLSKISFNYLFFFFCYRGALDRELKRNETGVSYPLHIIRNLGLNTFGRYTNMWRPNGREVPRLAMWSAA